MISLVVLLLVFLLIAVRQVGRIRLPIWQIMLLGAVAVLATGQISPIEALEAVNPDVMLFLFGMFVVGEALEESGYLSHLSHRLFGRARTLDGLVLLILFGMGTLSAFLMNDTLAIVGTPVALALAAKFKADRKVLLLALAFAVTIGSVMSPIGNPQNLLVAMNGDITNPFVTFLRYLFLPTMICLLLAYLLLRLNFRADFRSRSPGWREESISDPKLALLSQVSLALLITLVLAKIVTVFAGLNIDFRLTYIALASAAPILMFSRKRLTLVRDIDWPTLVFFAAMFILMEAVWNSDVLQRALDSALPHMTSLGMILVVSIVLSQFISNVPLVALYLPMLMEIGVSTRQLMALAAGSTIAGNLSILGAASNVIIIQNAEAKSDQTLTFWDFVKVGLPLTVVCGGVYWLFLTFV
ncbi:MAG: anion transporter [Chloroflexi bacterium]|nr:anion transporter [Chloroflexota bacterium]